MARASAKAIDDAVGYVKDGADALGEATKAELIAFAEGAFGLELSPSALKAELIDAILEAAEAQEKAPTP